ncbi:MAG: autotransporter outer membrane beta-barrel domain-containing protein [Myxococcales bacterium]
MYIQNKKRTKSASWLWLLVLVSASATAQAQNANPAFQTFFTDACGGAVGGSAFESRCTDNGVGDPTGISGDSEVSLTPSQAIAVNETAIGRLVSQGDQTAEIIEEKREEFRDADPPETALMNRWGLLLNGSWTGFDRDARGLVRGYDGDTFAVQVGADYRVDARSFVGGFFSYERTDTDFDPQKNNGLNFIAPSNNGNTDADQYSLTLIGSYNVTDALYLDASILGGITKYDLNRRAVYQNGGRSTLTNVRAKASPKAGNFAVSLGGGYEVNLQALSLTPYLRFQYAFSDVEGYSESDSSGMQMHFASDRQDSFLTVVGLRGTYVLNTAWGVLLPQARVEYEHESLRDAQTSKSRFVDDTSETELVSRGPSPDRDHVNVGVGVVMVLPGGWMPFVDWEGLYGNRRLDRNRVSFGIRHEL